MSDTARTIELTEAELEDLLERAAERGAERAVRRVRSGRGSRAKPAKKRKTAEVRRRAAEKADSLVRRHGHYPPRHGEGT